jgi:hypothetical protein
MAASTKRRSKSGRPLLNESNLGRATDQRCPLQQEARFWKRPSRISRGRHLERHAGLIASRPVDLSAFSHFIRAQPVSGSRPYGRATAGKEEGLFGKIESG